VKFKLGQPIFMIAAIVLVAGGLLVGLAISGLGGTPATATSTSFQPPTSSTSSTVPPTTVVVPVYNASQNARTDVTTGPCLYQDGTWNFSGSVHNTRPTAKEFVIVVDFVTVAGATGVATRVFTIPVVAAGATANWLVHGGNGVSGLTCVVQFALLKPTT
jgi:hypothetical protein